MDRPFVDLHLKHTLYAGDATLRPATLARIGELLAAPEKHGMAMELTLFSHERKPYLPASALEHLTRLVVVTLRPWRNMILQTWNEESFERRRCYEAAKEVDAGRPVTNSPGFAWTGTVTL